MLARTVILIFLTLFPFTARAGSPRSGVAQRPPDPAAKQELNQDDAEAFFESIKRGDVASINRALAAGVSPNLKDGEERPALLMAIRTGRAEVVKALLNGGADANADYKTWTALGLAAQNGHLEIVNLLLAKGARVNGEGDCHHTALIMAAQGALNKSMNEFLWQRIPPPARDNQEEEDYDGLDDVMNYGGDHVQIARTLIDKGADVNVKSDCETGDWTATALVTAAMGGNVELVQLLLAHGADPNRDTAATPLRLLTTDNEMMREEIHESDSPEERMHKQALNDWSESLRPAHDRIIEMLMRAGAK